MSLLRYKLMMGTNSSNKPKTSELYYESTIDLSPLNENAFLDINGKKPKIKQQYLGGHLYHVIFDREIISWNTLYSFTNESYGALISLILPESLKSIGVLYSAPFNYFYNLTNITFGNQLVSINNDTFGYCESLQKVILPDSIEYLADHVFIKCENLTDAIIGKNIKEIGYEIFDGCSSLESVTLLATVPPIITDEATFVDCNYSIYVPLKSINDYLTNDNYHSVRDYLMPIPE